MIYGLAKSQDRWNKHELYGAGATDTPDLGISRSWSGAEAPNRAGDQLHWRGDELEPKLSWS